MKAVKVHCGSAHVRGNARNYAYHVASVFERRETRDGRPIWSNTGRSTHPRRSFNLATADGRALAESTGATFVDGRGSLHNRPVATSHQL